MCAERNEEEDNFPDDNKDDLLSLDSQNGSSVGLGVAGGHQQVVVVAVEGVIYMIIEFNSVEYAMKEKQSVGISIDQFQQVVRHIMMAKAQRKILTQLRRML